MTEELHQSGVLLCTDIKSDILPYIEGRDSNQIFILTDENTQNLCAPILKEIPLLAAANYFTIPAGDDFKSLESLAKIWTFLGKHKASRHSLLINLGGGVISDIGGFAASTYKRGLNFYNIPTTLLSIVDAAVGGKTGINFDGLKNQIGVIRQPEHVFIDPQFLSTLDEENLVSGYAEMVKHALISSNEDWVEVTAFDIHSGDMETLTNLLWKSVAIKEKVVAVDPNEKGLRKALNFGHTIGHAIESVSHEKKAPILHGMAIAAGMVAELYLSHQKCNFPQEILEQAVHFIHAIYPPYSFGKKDYEHLYDLMTQDKKNEGNRINFTLLANIGDVRININCTKDEIYAAMDFYLKSAVKSPIN